MQKYALIVAGGKGERLNPELPKQFMMLNGKPMLMHTIEAFAAGIDGIVVVVPNDFTDYWNYLCKSNRFYTSHMVVSGGSRRCDSVQNGLVHIPDDCLVAIHDGARPLVSRKLIDLCFDTARIHGSAVPALPPDESVMMFQDGDFRCANRDHFRLVQTPQVFMAKLIKDAYRNTPNLHFTDDASVYEAGGGKPFLTDGERNNIKITTPFDFSIAGIMLVNRLNEGINPLD